VTDPSAQNQELDRTRRHASKDVEFSGVLSVKDAFAACTMAQPTSQRVATWIVRSILGVGLVLAVVPVVYALFVKDDGLLRFACVLLLLIGVVALASVGRWAQFRLRANRYWKQRKGLYLATTGRIDNDAIHVSTELATSSAYWSGFCGFRHSQDIAVLYWDFPKSFMIVARAKVQE